MYEDLNNIINELIVISNNVVNELRKFNINIAMNSFIEETYLIQSLIEKMNVHKDMIDYINTINDILKVLLEAIENKDYYLMSDILEYELLNKLYEIKNKLN